MANIVLDNVSRSFRRDGKEFLALDNVSFVCNDGEFVAVVGPSGCGKTTCMRMAAGLEFPSSGGVKVGGKGAGLPFIFLGLLITGLVHLLYRSSPRISSMASAYHPDSS